MEVFAVVFDFYLFDLAKMKSSPIKMPQIMYDASFRDHECIRYCRFWLWLLILILLGFFSLALLVYCFLLLLLFIILTMILHRMPALYHPHDNFTQRIKSARGLLENVLESPVAEELKAVEEAVVNQNPVYYNDVQQHGEEYEENQNQAQSNGALMGQEVVEEVEEEKVPEPKAFVGKYIRKKSRDSHRRHSKEGKSKFLEENNYSEISVIRKTKAKSERSRHHNGHAKHHGKSKHHDKKEEKKNKHKKDEDDSEDDDFEVGC